MNGFDPETVPYWEVKNPHSSGWAFCLFSVYLFLFWIHVDSFVLLKPMQRWSSSLSPAHCVSDHIGSGSHASSAAGSESCGTHHTARGWICALSSAESNARPFEPGVHVVCSQQPFILCWSLCQAALTYLLTVPPSVAFYFTAHPDDPVRSGTLEWEGWHSVSVV